MVIKNDSCHRNVDWWDFAVGNHSIGLAAVSCSSLVFFLKGNSVGVCGAFMVR